MKFCTNCNGLVVKSKDKAICISCNKEYEDFTLSATEKLVKKEEVAVIKEKDSEVLPKIYHICKKCNARYAYFWHTHGIGDEADTVYHKCVKCNYTTQQGRQRGGR